MKSVFLPSGSLARSLIAAGLLLGDACAADALQRMQLEALEATHNAVEQFQLDRQPVTLSSDYNDVRSLLHIHSHLSHDSIGTLEEIHQAAVQANVKVIMFTDHPADDYDYIRDGHRGMRNGVLFIPGAEEKGLLAFPQRSVQRLPEFTPQQKVDTVRAADGQVYLSHLEERMEWELEGLTGTEIYNIHADFKDEPGLIQALRNPLALLNVINPAFQQYPQEALAALQDYPADYLRRWDELNPKHRLTGISANDAHQNTGVKAVVAENGTLQILDTTNEPLAELDTGRIAGLKLLTAGKQVGDIIFDLQLDPYVRSFSHVSTHLMMHSFDEAAVREALAAGRAYVAFDWMCDPTGFIFQATSGDNMHAMGSDIPLSDDLTLQSEAPLNGTFKIIHNGREIHYSRGRSLQMSVKERGVYRVEVWLNFPDEPRIWILSNPIYVK